MVHIGHIIHNNGDVVDMDTDKAVHHWELAAIKGDERARHDLGCTEGNYGDIDRAMKHFVIAAKNGHEGTLEYVCDGYKSGLVTKDVYTSTLHAYKATQDGMRSEQRRRAGLPKEDDE